MLGSLSNKDLSTSSKDTMLMFTFNMPSVKVVVKETNKQTEGNKENRCKSQRGE